MKTFMKKSSLALLLTVLMLLSALTIGATLFAASAEEAVSEGSSESGVTFIVKDKKGEEAFRYTAELADGAALPAWQGVIWNGNETLKTHTAGTSTYTATWAPDASTAVLYKFQGDDTYYARNDVNDFFNNETMIRNTSANDLDDDGFVDVDANKDGTISEDERRTAASENVIYLLDNSTISYFNCLNKFTANTNFTFYGNGHTIRVNPFTNGATLFRFRGENSIIRFEDVIFDGDVRVTQTQTLDENGKPYVTFDKISTEASDPVVGCGGGNGGLFHTAASSIRLELKDVTIKNFVANNSTQIVQRGAAIFAQSGAAYLDNVEIFNCYSSGDGSGPLEGNIHISGTTSFHDNYRLKCLSKTSGSTYEYDKFVCLGEVDHDNGFVYFEDSSYTGSFSFGLNTGLDATFAYVKENKIPDAAELKNIAKKNYLPAVSETATNGYYALTWDSPKENVTVTVYDKSNTKVILTYDTQFGVDRALPAWTGATWSNGTATVTTHTYGTKSYTASWNEGSSVVALYKLYGDTEYQTTTALNSDFFKKMTGGTKASDNVIELLADISITGTVTSSGTTDDVGEHFTLKGNGHVIKPASDYSSALPMFHFEEAGDRIAFENVIFNGNATITESATVENGLKITTAFNNGGQGALVRSYTDGIEISMTDVTITNFAQARKSEGQYGAALWTQAATKNTLTNVTITGNYGTGGPAIYSTVKTATLILEGNCTFEDNWLLDYDSTNEVYVKTDECDINWGSAPLYIDEDFTTDLLVFASGSSGTILATLKGEALNENANLVCFTDATLSPVIVGTDIVWASESTVALYKLQGATKYTAHTSADITAVFKAISALTHDAEAAPTVVSLLSDATMTYVGTGGFKNYTKFVFYGNGHTVRQTATESGHPTFRFQSANSFIRFENVIFDGDIQMTVTNTLSPNGKKYVAFDRISTTDVVDPAVGIGAGNGGLFSVYASGVSLELSDVTIKNFVQNRTNSPVLYGAAIGVEKGAKAYLENVTIHDCVSTGDMSAIHGGPFYVSGQSSFYNNYSIAYINAGSSWNDSAALVNNFELGGEMTFSGGSNIFFKTDYVPTEGETLIFGYDPKLESTFAYVADPELLANVSFKAFSADYLFPAVAASADENGYYALTWDAVTENVSVVVKSKDGKKEILSLEDTFAVGMPLPTWAGAIWNDDESLTVHKEGTTKYFVTWNETATAVALASKDNGSTWAAVTSLKDAANSSSYTNIEVLGDADGAFVLTESLAIDTSGKYTMDFNGFVVTRAEASYQITAEKSTARNVTIYNAKFDGEEKESSVAFVELKDGCQGLTFDTCNFYNFKTTANGSIVYSIRTATLTLKDVKIYNNVSTQGAIRNAFGDSNSDGVDEALRLYLAGKTEIFTTKEYPSNVVWNAASIGITADFDGTVEVTGGPFAGGLNQVIASAENEAYATVAEGAKITGTIKNIKTNLFAAAVDGKLMWTKADAALPATDFDVDKNNKFTVYNTPWCYYDENNEPVKTYTYVDGIYNYFVGEYGLDEGVEAYIVDKICGDIVLVSAAAKDGDTIEIIKSVTTEGIIIPANCTVNGNGMTLTVTPKSEGGTKHLMQVTGGSAKDPRTVIINNLTFHGGSPAENYGKWEIDPESRIREPIAAKDVALLYAGAVGQNITLNDCVFTGHRVVTSGDKGSPIYNSQANISFYNCTIADNFAKSVMRTVDKDNNILETPVDTIEYANYALRCMDAGCVSFYGKTVVCDNYGVWSDDSSVVSKGVYAVNPNRVYIGELAEESDIVLCKSDAAIGYIAELDKQGIPYDNRGYISVGGTVTKDENGVYSEARTMQNLYCANTSLTNAQNGNSGARFYVLQTPAIAKAVKGQAGITKDKLTLTVHLPIKADFFGTNIVVKLNGKELSSTPLRSFSATQTSFADNVLAIPVTVGMAELTGVIKIELQDASTKEVLAFFDTSAKDYANEFLGYTLEGLAEHGYNYTEDQLTSLKSAMAALLQYGQMVQNYFKVDAPDAVTEADLVHWESLKLTLKLVDNDVLDTSKASDLIKASVSGVLPEDVTVSGSTLTMENEISLRFYFTATNIDGHKFTVNGTEVTPVNTNKGYYIEASHIGTQNLATRVTFGIDGYTYTVSPMTYVYTVNKLDIGQYGITQELKNACEALYYYYIAVGDCFLKPHDPNYNTTGFLVSSELQLLTDGVNTFSAPRKVVVA